MCRLVMIGISGFQGDIADRFRRQPFDVEAAVNPSVSVMPADARKYQLTCGGCSCDLYAWDTDEVSGEFQVLEKRRAKYQRDGWSQAKIDRALEAARTALDRPERRSPAADAFVESVVGLVREGARVTLLAHDFTGLFTDPFTVSGQEVIRVDDFESRRGAFPADTLVTISG